MSCTSTLSGPPLLQKVVPTQPRKTKIKNFSVAGAGDWRADRDERLENEFRVLQKDIEYDSRPRILRGIGERPSTTV